MIPSSNTPQSPAVESKRLYFGKRFAPLVEGQETPTPMSAEYFNQFVALAQAVCNMKFSDPGMGQIAYSDSNIVFTVSNTGSNTPGSSNPVTTSGSLALGCYQVTAATPTGQDYYYAQHYSSGGATGAVVAIAKPYEMRTSLGTEVIDGVTVTYDHGSPKVDNVRTATASGTNQIEVCFPRFGSGQIIWASQADHTLVYQGGTEVPLMELSPSRFWLRQAPST